jgi:putative tricarboxylic transport membrane protein
MKVNDAIWGALLILLGLTIILHVQHFPMIPGQKIGPAMFPGLASAGIMICGVLLIINGLKARARAGERWWQPGDWVSSPRHLSAFVVFIGGVTAYILFAQAIGFLILAPIVLIAWFLVLRVRPRVAVVTAIIATLVIWYAFYKLLRVPLPWGVLSSFAF